MVLTAKAKVALTRGVLFFRKLWVLALLLLSTEQAEAKEVVLEGKASYFLSTNTRFRDVYGGSGLYRLETQLQVKNAVYAWINLGYMYASGRSSVGSPTHLHFVPLSSGVSYIYQAGRLQPYLGLGPALAYAYIHNGSNRVTRHQDGWGGGFLSKIGLLAYFNDQFFFDFFADYSFIRMSYHHTDKEVTRHKGDLSGLSFGMGLGYQF